MNNYESLTPRQKEVLKWRAYGLGKHKIAKKLGLSVHTVLMHLNDAYLNLGVGGFIKDMAPSNLASIVYWQNNLDELKKINISDLV